MENAPPPFSMMTVWGPLPMQYRCRRRPPMSISLPGGGGSVDGCAESVVANTTAAVMCILGRDGREQHSVGGGCSVNRILGGLRVPQNKNSVAPFLRVIPFPPYA